MQYLHRLTVVLCMLQLFMATAYGQENISTSCPFQVIATIIPPSCPGGADGSVEVVLTNAIAPISVEWLDVPTQAIDGNTAEFLEAGSHSVRVEDGSGCFDTLWVALNDPPNLVEVSLFPEDSRCFGANNGIIDIEPNYPDKVARYLVNGQERTPIITNAIRRRFANLEPGNYSIVIEDIEGCQQEKYASIAEPQDLDVQHIKKNTTCHDSNDGSLRINVTGGVGGYNYSLNGVDYQPEGLFENLEPREYDLFVKDGNQCVASRNFTITAAPEPEITIEQENVTCPGGSDASFIVIIETVGGGYQFSLDGDIYQSDTTFSNLSAGVYTLHTRNPRNCVSLQTIVVEEPDEPEITIEQENVSCPGGSDASFIVIIETVGGGYEFSIDGNIYQQDSLFSNLPAGVYTVHARSPENCIATQTVIVEEPRVPNMSINKDDVSCPGGSDASFIVIIETVGGGYEYSIDGNIYQQDSLFSNLPAGVYTVYARNANGCIFNTLISITEPNMPSINLQVDSLSCAGSNDGTLLVSINPAGSYEYSLDGVLYQSANTFNGLSAGSYLLYIRSSIGCLFEQSFIIGAPNPLINGMTSGASSCGQANGWIASTANGGTFPYTYAWSNGSSAPVATDLHSGQYHLTISDSHGCQLQDSLLLLDQNAPLLRTTTTDASCNGIADGAVDLNIEAVSPITEIRWSNGKSSEDLSGLMAGNYSVTVIDANFCYNSQEIIIKEPKALIATGYVEKVGNTGAISLEISGGTQPYFCSWSNGAISPSIESLSPGQYAVTVSDSKQCNFISSFEILPAQRPMEENVRIFPVPTMYDAHIAFDLPAEQEVSIDLLDELGRLVMRMPKTLVLNEKISIDMETLPAGAYLVRIYLGTEIIVRRIIKHTD